MVERPFGIPNRIVRRLHPLNIIRLWRIHEPWLEYKNLATLTAEDFDKTRSVGQSNETLEYVAYAGLLLKTMVWITELTIGTGLMVAAKASRRKPVRGLALVGGMVSLLLATQDFRDTKRALSILDEKQDKP